MKVYTQNINIPIVLRVIGWLLMIEAGFMVLPACVSCYFEEWNCALSFLYSAGITVAAGALMTFGIKPKSMALRRREGFLLTAIIWVFFSAFSMFPFLFSGVLNNITDAFFESMSGFTTTGGSVIYITDQTPKGILFWRALTQWIGGMGIILFTLAVLPMLNYQGGISMFNAEVTGITHERMRPRVSQTAMYMWGMYIIFTAILYILLFLGPMDNFDALCHTLSTVSTGGFYTTNKGLGAWDDMYSNGMIMIFMFLCGTNFSLLYSVSHGYWELLEHAVVSCWKFIKLIFKFDVAGLKNFFNIKSFFTAIHTTNKDSLKALRKSNTFKWYVIVILVTAIFIVSSKVTSEIEAHDHNLFEHAFGALFDTISAITSTGFSAIDFEHGNFGPFISFFLFLAMFFGSMAGSTAGGAKIDRLIVMVKNVKNEFYKVLHPNAVTSVRIEGRSVSQEIILKVLAFISIYVVILVGVALALTFMDFPGFDAFFTSMSAISNVGYGYGVTGTTWAHISPFAKWLLALEMMIGRLELFTVLVLFTKGFWVKD